MIAQLLLTFAAMAVLMLGYYLVQRGLRRVSPEIGHDSDVLETRWGCGLCLFKQRKSCPRHGRCRRDAAPRPAPPRPARRENRHRTWNT